MLYAQNGATDAKLRGYEHEQKNKGLREKTGSTLKFGSGSRNTVPEVRRCSQKGSENTIASM